MTEEIPDWRLKLRYGKLKTPFTHFTVLADGEAQVLVDGFECRPGRAWMGMKVWATDTDESMNMARVIGEQIGFFVDGRIQVYETEPEIRPGDDPHAYEINFTPYENE